MASHKGDMYLFIKSTFRETTMIFLHHLLFEIVAMKKWKNIEWKDYQRQRINISLSLFFYVTYEFSISMTIANKLPTSSENHHSLVLDSLITARLLCTCTASVFVERSSKLHVYPERWREARAG